jgi:hypothetical protein
MSNPNDLESTGTQKKAREKKPMSKLRKALLRHLADLEGGSMFKSIVEDARDLAEAAVLRKILLENPDEEKK